MDKFLAWLETAINDVNAILADYILVILLVGVGLFFTIRTKFVQVRCFKQGMKNVFGGLKLKGEKHESGMSSFQAVATAIAAQVGTGNIVGACGAILVGGPGAIFWMWIIAFLGMATIYAEAVLAQKTRKINEDGSVSGGPVYYIRTAFKGKFGKFLAGFFAVAAVICLGFVGAMVQSNSISSAVASAGGFDYKEWGWIAGIIIAVLSLLIFIGGAKRIASVTEKIVPIMAVVYLIGGLIILCVNITALPIAFWYILKYAFNPSAIIGGGFGYALKTAISMGAKRGLFSNEAGMGSTPHAHAQANVKTPHEQGTAAMISVFIDTFIVLTMTALIVITSLYVKNPELLTSATSNNMVELSIASLFTNASVGDKIGAIFVAVCLTFFAFSTIISWNLFGRINFEYLFGKKSSLLYSLIATIFVFLGSLLSNGLVWSANDFFNYMMVFPNAIALIALASMVVKELKTNGKKSAVDTPNQPLTENLVDKK
ncbi:MAG: sodium:alanine symporter family protein [Clostridia bacterium]|nr:sodium:alanine symporter family protein [Clostridia bacterium]